MDLCEPSRTTHTGKIVDDKMPTPTAPPMQQ